MSLSNKKILVVDDAKENAVLFKIFLEEASAEVEIAFNGAEAVSKIKDSHYDMVLMDLEMPILNGYQAIIKMRELSFNKPIIALTSHTMKEERDKTKEAGFDDHITKPLTADSLVSTCEKHLGILKT